MNSSQVRVRSAPPSGADANSTFASFESRPRCGQADLRVSSRIAADGFQIVQSPVSTLGRPQERFGHSFARFVIAVAKRLVRLVASPMK